MLTHIIMKLNLIIILLFVTGPVTPRPSETELQTDKEVVCFVYHRFGDSRYAATNTSIDDFEKHLAYLTENNFQVLSFSEAMKYLKSNESARKTAVITIDDGYKSFYKSGLPLLKKYGTPATLFINTKTVGAGDYMNWDQLIEAKQNNIEIGNHTHSHDFFLNESESLRYEKFKREIKKSQTIISEHLGITPKVFSYPYGEFDGRMKDIVKKEGFIAAAAQNSGVIDSESDLFTCPRFPMSEAYSTISKFIDKASMKRLKILDVSPDDFIMPESQKPLLELTIDNTGLNLKQMQCFSQGGDCVVRIKESTGRRTSFTVQAARPIKGRRRTLYTITVPDKNGAWHWYSHLWINRRVN